MYPWVSVVVGVVNMYPWVGVVVGVVIHVSLGRCGGGCGHPWVGVVVGVVIHV